MYQVSKNGITFYVQDEETALKYAKDGYDVLLQTRLEIGSDGKLQERSPKISVTGVSNSKSKEITKRK